MNLPLLDLMQPPTPPIWRNGAPLPLKPWRPSEQGDLQWFAHDYRDHRRGGRWYCYNARESIWVCIDPYDQNRINRDKDVPPTVNEFGRVMTQRL
jgi:hypothetical protein